MTRRTVTIPGTEQRPDAETKWDSGPDRWATDHETAATVGAGLVAKSVERNRLGAIERRPVVPVWFAIDEHRQRVKTGPREREDTRTAVLPGDDVTGEFEAASFALWQAHRPATGAPGTTPIHDT